MNDRTTFETANRLKAAGFPQPEPAPGQVWYSANGILFFLASDVEGKLIFCSIHGANIGTATALNKCTYATTAPDILRELGELSVLVYEDNQFITGGLNMHGEFIAGIPQLMDNPAEACALAWLAQNER